MQIGKVRIDDSCYPGEDLYTDGSIEDEMLKMAKELSEDELQKQIAVRGSWPLLYHFSSVRGNIVRWLPFTRADDVLEIGSGCGAVTGTLCSMAGSVDAVDLSMKRSLVNAFRNQNRENLTIWTGNFEDVEKSLKKRYDYITLIGVFEYARLYIHSDRPFTDFLKVCRRHLKPGGQLIIAIENRFGLKYWAGCTEDHDGLLFDGLEGYPSGTEVRTFTRKELTGIIKEAGGFTDSWFYPFPDYKLALEIHSDRRLPLKGELNRAEYNYDRLALKLFDESRVFDSVLENGLYPWFANSYLVILKNVEDSIPSSHNEALNMDSMTSDHDFTASADGLQKTKPVSFATSYVKFSLERAASFRLITKIESAALHTGEADKQENSLLPAAVIKEAAEEAADAHIAALAVTAEELREAYRPAGLLTAPCQLQKARSGRCEAVYPFIEGRNLEEYLDELMDRGQVRDAAAVLLEYAGKLRIVGDARPFVMTPDFEKVFGTPMLPDHLSSAEVTNIDVVPSNLMIHEDGRATVLDVEWTFSFPVPSGYVIYRFLHYYMESDGKRYALHGESLYERAGLSEAELSCYPAMEEHFQTWLLSGTVPLRLLYPVISPGRLPVQPVFEQGAVLRGRGELQVFYDMGEGFCEDHSELFPMQEGVMEIPIPALCREVRIDPGEYPVGFSAVRLLWQDGEQVRFRTNGVIAGEGVYFPMPDPQLLINDIPSGKSELRLELVPDLERDVMRYGVEEMRRQLEERIAETQRRTNELELCREQIRQMENTKVWKLYRKCKSVLAALKTGGGSAGNTV